MTRREVLKAAAAASVASTVRECRRRREELTREEQPGPDVRPTEPFPALFLPALTGAHHG